MRHWFAAVRALPVLSKWILLGSLINSLGIGVALPIGMLFVQKILHVPIAQASLLVPITAASSLLAHTFAGHLSDRFGSFAGSVIPTGVGVVGALLYASAGSFAGAVVAAVVTGIGNGSQTGWISFLARASPEKSRPFVFSVNQTGMNAGIGLGLAVSAIVSSLQNELVFRLAFGMKAAIQVFLVVLVCRVVWASLRLPKSETSRRDEEPPPRGAGFLLLVLGLINFSMIAFGVAQLESIVIAGLLSVPSFPGWMIPASVLINVVVIVVSNISFGVKLSRFNPVWIFVLVGPLWGICWLICAFALRVTGWSGVWIFLGAMGLFAFGECVTSMALPSLIASLSARTTFGRSYGYQNSVNALAFTVGPLITSALLLRGAASSVFLVLAILIQLMPLCALVLRGRMRRA